MTGQPDDLKNLWRDQPTETPPMTLEQIHARGFQDRVQRRNRIEYVACAIVVVVFSAYVFILPGPVLKAASALCGLAAVYVAFQLHRRGSARPAPAADALAFHRAELVRQQEALRSAWAWYLAPFLPGFALFLTGLLQAQPEAPLAWKLTLPVMLLLYGSLWFWNNHRAIRRLEAQIAEIDALRRD